MSQKIIKIGLLLLLIVAVGLFFIFDLSQYSTLEQIKQHRLTLQGYYEQNSLLVLIVFVLIYVSTTALSLPIATALTLLAGGLFGMLTGLVVVSFASTIGATLAFLLARFLVYDFVQKHYARQLVKINIGFKREGAFYLFALRLVPVFPFFIVNVAVALLPVKTWMFYWISQLGMLPATAVYIYAGTQLAAIESLSDITSVPVLIAFAMLGLFPLIAKKGIGLWRKELNVE